MPQPAPVSLEQLLDAVPVRNEAVEASQPIGRNGGVLSVPVQRRWWMGGPVGWVMPFRDRQKLGLDVLGREVWDAMDGESTLETIIEAFAQRHKLRWHEARVSVMAFVKGLVDRRLAVVAVREVERR